MQQINLYLAEFQPSREPLRSIHMLWGIAVLVLFLGIFSYFSAQGNRELAEQVEKSRVQLEQLKSQALLLEQQRPKGSLVDLDTQILKLRDELTKRDRILHVVSDKNLGNNIGFSTHLQALGRQSLRTVSLEAFSLLAGGSYVEFAGTTSSVDQIPLYIQRLRDESAFASSAFGVLNAKSQKDNSGAFSFTLAREMVEPEAERAKTAVQKLLELNEKAKEQAGGQN